MMQRFSEEHCIHFLSSLFQILIVTQLAGYFHLQRSHKPDGHSGYYFHEHELSVIVKEKGLRFYCIF